MSEDDPPAIPVVAPSTRERCRDRTRPSASSPTSPSRSRRGRDGCCASSNATSSAKQLLNAERRPGGIVTSKWTRPRPGSWCGRGGAAATATRSCIAAAISPRASTDGAGDASARLTPSDRGSRLARRTGGSGGSIIRPGRSGVYGRDRLWLAPASHGVVGGRKATLAEDHADPPPEKRAGGSRRRLEPGWAAWAGR